MNSVLAILFVVVATVIGKWLLFDDDDPKADSEQTNLVEPPTESEPPRLSKSA